MEPTLSEVGRISLRMDKKFGPADRAVASLAARQHGVVAVDQLIALGLGASQYTIASSPAACTASTPAYMRSVTRA
jgi:hypothetical protein